MKLHGTLQANLEAALQAIRRRHGQAVYPDTLAYWKALLAFARLEARNVSGPEASSISILAEMLEEQLQARERAGRV